NRQRVMLQVGVVKWPHSEWESGCEESRNLEPKQCSRNNCEDRSSAFFLSCIRPKPKVQVDREEQTALEQVVRRLLGGDAIEPPVAVTQTQQVVQLYIKVPNEI